MNCDNCKLYTISCTGGEYAKDYCEKNGIYKPITNADRIRAMSDEELAKLFTEIQSDATNTYTIFPKFPDEEEAWNKWLRKEYKE